MKQQLIRCIENYSPYCEQEQKEKEVILNYLNEYDNLLTRENEYAHFTASSLIVKIQRKDSKQFSQLLITSNQEFQFLFSLKEHVIKVKNLVCFLSMQVHLKLLTVLDVQSFQSV